MVKLFQKNINNKQDSISNHILNDRKVSILGNLYSKENILGYDICNAFEESINQKFGGKVNKFHYNLYSSIQLLEKIEKSSFRSDEEKSFLKGYLKNTKNILEINYLEIKDYERGQGIGKEFINFLQVFCKENNIDGIVIESHKNAIGFWKKAGFEILMTGLYNASEYHPGFLEIKKDM